MDCKLQEMLSRRQSPQAFLQFGQEAVMKNKKLRSMYGDKDEDYRKGKKKSHGYPKDNDSKMQPEEQVNKNFRGHFISRGRR